MTTKNEDLVIRGNEVFARTEYLTPMGDMDRLIHEVLGKGQYSFLPIMFPPLLRTWTLGTWFANEPSGKTVLTFTEVAYFPLPGAAQIQYGDGDEWQIQPIPDDGYTGYRTWDNPKWTPPEGCRMFVMLPWILELRQIDTNPYMFVVENGTDPYMFKFPNIFDTGRICVGSSFRNRNDEDVSATDNIPLAHIKHGLDLIRTTRMNNDLRKNDNEFARWDEDFNQINLPVLPKHKNTVTDERIIEFTKWIKSHG